LNPHEPKAHYALNVARLPVPPLRHRSLFYLINWFCQLLLDKCFDFEEVTWNLLKIFQDDLLKFILIIGSETFLHPHQNLRAAMGFQNDESFVLSLNKKNFR